MPTRMERRAERIRLQRREIARWLAELAVVLLAASGGFAGLSILAQNLVFLRPLGVSLPALAGIAVLRALFAALAMAIMLAVC